MTDDIGIPRTKSGVVVLEMPLPRAVEEGRENELANLCFGPAGLHDADHHDINICFQAQGDGTGIAVVRGDHPLLDALFVKYPQVRIVTDDKHVSYLCSVCDDGREFAGKPQLRSHMRTHATPSAG
jgi:hypothetical protein